MQAPRLGQLHSHGAYTARGGVDLHKRVLFLAVPGKRGAVRALIWLLQSAGRIFRLVDGELHPGQAATFSVFSPCAPPLQPSPPHQHPVPSRQVRNLQGLRR